MGYLILDSVKYVHCQGREVIEVITLEKWNKRGMSISTIIDLELDFAMRVIRHKFYQSRKPQSVPCVAINVAWKIVKKDNSYDLADLQLQ